MTDTPAPVVYDDGVQSHSEDKCQWKPSAIYPGSDACLVNGAAHYRATPAPVTPRNEAAYRLQGLLDWERNELLDAALAEERRLAIECEAAAPAATEAAARHLEVHGCNVFHSAEDGGPCLWQRTNE